MENVRTPSDIVLVTSRSLQLPYRKTSTQIVDVYRKYKSLICMYFLYRGLSVLCLVALRGNVSLWEQLQTVGDMKSRSREVEARCVEKLQDKFSQPVRRPHAHGNADGN